MSNFAKLLPCGHLDWENCRCAESEAPSPVTVEKEVTSKTREPDVIYLQYHGDGPAEDDGKVRDCDVTWCRDRIFESDIKYVRAHSREKDAVSATTVQEKETLGEPGDAIGPRAVPGQMELLPCPFCGEQPRLSQGHFSVGGWVYYLTQGCPAFDRRATIARWNQRVTPSSPKATESADVGVERTLSDILASALLGEFPVQIALARYADSLAEPYAREVRDKIASVEHTKEAEKEEKIRTEDWSVLDHFFEKRADAGLKEAASDNVKVQMKLNRAMTLVKNLRLPHGTCEPRSRKACTHCNSREELDALADSWPGARLVLSENATRSSSATSVSSPNPSLPASVEHVEQEKKKALEEKEA